MLAFTVAGVPGARARAQVPTVSADQLELLRTLSPEDRDALLKQMGIGDASNGLLPGRRRP